MVEGTLKATIFIDGVETMQNEVKNIDAATIDKVEVLNNPTADYGTSFTGAIINLITKKSSEQFSKGSIGLGGGIKNNQWSSIPSLNFKKGIVSIKMEMFYSTSDQTVWRERSVVNKEEYNKDDKAEN